MAFTLDPNHDATQPTQTTYKNMYMLSGLSSAVNMLFAEVR